MNEPDLISGSSQLPNIVPVIDTIPADLLTPLSVYLKLSKGAKDSFLLESVEGGENLARFSFIGAEPEFVVRGNDRQTTVSDGISETREAIGIIDYLKRHFSDALLDEHPDLPFFSGGAIGMIEFSASEWFEPSLRREASEGQAEAAFMVFRSLVAFDHAKQSIYLTTLVFTDEAQGDRKRLDGLLDAARDSNAERRRVLESDGVCIPTCTSHIPTEPRSNWVRGEFENAVVGIKDSINAGDCYQVVLSQRFTKTTNTTAVGIYRALRSLNPSPYMFLLNFGSLSVIGTSPEMLVRCRGVDLEYRPIAGTRKRGKTELEDRSLASEMQKDEKEIAEHLMLVDLGRNDLGRVAEFGSVTVDELMSVERYSHVQHMVSSISARLREGLTRFDALAACFPAGTVSGAPKVKAIEMIREIEPTDRGIYAGAVGYFDYSGNMDTCIAIRTLVLEDGIATVQAGAGIVADSIPSLEYEETVNKAKALLKAISIAEAQGS
jgi:anthranilate synthase component 1